MMQDVESPALGQPLMLRVSLSYCRATVLNCSRMKQFDFLILGSGIAGLSFALKVAPYGKVAIITKKDRAESNTNYAQGGIAAVTSKEDSFELHVRDTLQAGAGLCKREQCVRLSRKGRRGSRN